MNKMEEKYFDIDWVEEQLDYLYRKVIEVNKRAAELEQLLRIETERTRREFNRVHFGQLIGAFVTAVGGLLLYGALK